MDDVNRRLTEKLLRYWLKLRGNRPFPLENEIDQEELSDIWDSCFLVEVRGEDKKRPYRYTYLGKELIDAYGGDVSNEEICKNLVSPYTKRVTEKFDELLSTRKPVSDDTEYMNSNNITIKYRQVLLPFGNAKGEVEYILGGMRWKPC